MTRFSVLIVCSDLRSLELGKVLASHPEFDVYRRWESGGKISFSRLESEEWNAIKDNVAPPSSFSCAFFHTGSNDPSVIPVDKQLGRMFAFSGEHPDLSRLPEKIRDEVIPIQRRFGAGRCPFRPRHLSEFIGYLLNPGGDPPSFCRPEDSLPILNSIAILCQVYAAALASVKGAHAVAGWGDLGKYFFASGSRFAEMGESMGKFLNDMEVNSWWKRKLGYWDEQKGAISSADMLSLSISLVCELELEALVSNMLGVADLRECKDGQAVLDSMKTALNALNNSTDDARKTCGLKTIALLESSASWHAAADTYCAISGFLKTL